MRALRALFRERPAAYEGRFFSFAGISIEPPPAQPAGRRSGSAGRSEPAIRRAATLGDGWIPIWVSAEAFARSRSCRSTSTPAVTLPAHVGDPPRCYEHLRARYSGEFGEHVIDRYCVAGTPEQCVARVREYIDAGAQHVVFNILELDDADRLMEVARAAAG